MSFFIHCTDKFYDHRFHTNNVTDLPQNLFLTVIPNIVNSQIEIQNLGIYRKQAVKLYRYAFQSIHQSINQSILIFSVIHYRFIYSRSLALYTRVYFTHTDLIVHSTVVLVLLHSPFTVHPYF